MSLFTTTDEIISTYKTQSLQSQFISMIEETIDKEKLLSQKFPPDFISPEKNGKIYFKMTNDTEIHRFFQYKDGLNFDPNKFNPSGCCSGGGLYFTKLENLYRFKDFGKNIRPLFVPNGVPIYDELCTDSSHKGQCPNVSIKSKAPIIYLLPKIKLGSSQSINLLFDETKMLDIPSLQYDPSTSIYDFMRMDDVIYLKSQMINTNNNMITPYMYLSDNLAYLNHYRNSYYNMYKYFCCNINSKMIQRGKRQPKYKEFIHSEVKCFILENNYNELFDNIYYKKYFLNSFYNNTPNYYYKDTFVTVSELFYIFLKHQDKSFLHFMKNEYFPRFISLPNIVNAMKPCVQLNIPRAVDNIKTDIENLIDMNIAELIVKYKGKISGSLAVKNFTGMNWKCNDIDVYLPAIEYDKTADSLWDHPLLKDIRESVENTAYVDEYPPKTQSYNMTGIDSIINVKQKNNINIQFIFVNVEPFEFIKDNFDFDFCKCCYNMIDSTYEIAHPNLNTIQDGRIDKAYMDKILKYDMTDNYSVYRAAKTMERIIKYIERGFNITNLNEFLDCIEKLFDD